MQAGPLPTTPGLLFACSHAGYLHSMAAHTTCAAPPRLCRANWAPPCAHYTHLQVAAAAAPPPLRQLAGHAGRPANHNRPPVATQHRRQRVRHGICGGGAAGTVGAAPAPPAAPMPALTLLISPVLQRQMGRC